MISCRVSIPLGCTELAPLTNLFMNFAGLNNMRELVVGSSHWLVIIFQACPREEYLDGEKKEVGDSVALPGLKPSLTLITKFSIFKPI